MIDRVHIQEGISNIVDEIFLVEEVLDSDIEIFVKEVIRFVEREFDTYVKKNEIELIEFIPQAKKKEFNDFSNGYVRKMRCWMDEHPVNIRKLEIPTEKIVENMPNQVAVKEALAIAGIGTIVVIGISFFTSALVAIIAEIIALSIAYAVYKKKNNVKEVQKIALNLDEIKRQMISLVIQDIGRWLDEAELASEQLIKMYKENSYE